MHLSYTARDYILDIVFIDASTLGQLVQGLRQQLLGMDAGKCSFARLPATARGTYCIKNIGRCHSFSPQEDAHSVLARSISVISR